jgi:hypothetical protein
MDAFYEEDERSVRTRDLRAGKKLAPEPGQGVVAHGIDRRLDPDELLERRDSA